MAVVQVSIAPNRERYELVRSYVNVAGDRPAGLILHAASELPSGEIQIVDVFEDAEALAAFGQDRMMPAFGRAGALTDNTARPAPGAYPAFDLVR